MQNIEINTLAEKYAQMLRAKFTEDQAQALMGVWAQAVSLHPDATTKADLKDLKMTTQANIVATKTDLKNELEKLETKMMNHFRYIYAGGGLIITALFTILAKVF